MPESGLYRPRHNACPAPAGGTHRKARVRTPSKRGRRLGLLLPALGLAAAVGLGSGPAANADGGQIFFGVDGTAGQAARATPLSLHTYSQMNRSVPNARMITMGTGGLHWNQISSAGPGSSTYNNIVNWANTLRGRTGPTLLTFSHEPEASAKRGYGTSAEYVQAFQHVVDIFRSQGVSNVEWTWQMTGNAFRVSPSDARYAAKWYPGDSYVDNVAADVYNWSNCRSSGAWTELSTAAAPMLAFARAHGKKAVLAEYASDSGSQRVQWLNNVHQYLVDNADTFRAAYYFDHPNNTGCSWALTSNADISAFTAMAQDPLFTQ